jgi:hypothetical protein
MHTGLSPTDVETKLLSNENNMISTHGSASIKGSVKIVSGASHRFRWYTNSRKKMTTIDIPTR